jgi:hypothetical protein
MPEKLSCCAGRAGRPLFDRRLIVLISTNQNLDFSTPGNQSLRDVEPQSVCRDKKLAVSVCVRSMSLACRRG